MEASADPQHGEPEDDTTLEVSEEEEEEIPHPQCPLCRIDDINVETASMVMSSSTNNYIRKIMSYELANFGTVPDSVIYRNIARNYNKTIAKEMRNAGIQCELWDAKMVKRHFEVHVQLVPRRVLGHDLRRLEAMSRLVDREIQAGVARAEQSFLGVDIEQVEEGPPATELVEAKFITKQINLIKARHAVLRDYRAYVKEDMVATGIQTLYKSVELGETTAAEAKKLIESAALLQTAAGASDLPDASELFG